MKLKRRKVSSDFVLALSALLISFVIWLIAAEADFDTDNLTVPIKLVNAPKNYQIEIIPNEAIITVQYPKSLKSSIISPNFFVEIDLNNVLEFARREPDISTTWVITTADVQKQNVTERVKVIEIAQPKRLAIQAKMYIENAMITPVVNGELKPGYRLAEKPSVRPPQLKVTGPPALLTQLKKQSGDQITLKTTPIDITGESTPFFRTVKVILTEGLELVNPTEEFVQVIFGVTEVEETKQIRNVPILIKTFTQNLTVDYSPQVATIEIKAPRSLIQELSANDFYCEPVQPIQETVGFQGKVAIEAKFREEVVQRLRDKVTITGVQPEAVEITVKQLKKN